LATFGALITAYPRRRAPTGGPEELKPVVEPEVRPEVTPRAPARGKAVSEMGLVDLFNELVMLLELSTGVAFKPSYTLREYLIHVRERLPEQAYGLIARAFQEVERIAYGNPKSLAPSAISNAADLLRRSVLLLRELVEGL